MIHIRDLYKSYQTGKTTRSVLSGINFSVEKGDMIALMGQSGTGKSTLLNIIGLLDSFDRGDYSLNGMHVNQVSRQEANSYRTQLIGFVFQRFHLIPFKTALENVALPLYYQGVGKAARLKRALELLDRMGLVSYAQYKPGNLSGGQQQRVAIARALVAAPPLILADEPTGALDSRTAHEIMALLKEMNKEGNTIVVATHASEVARQCNSIQEMVDGKIV